MNSLPLNSPFPQKNKTEIVSLWNESNFGINLSQNTVDNEIVFYDEAL